MGKMLTLKQKILTPMFLIIILTPIITLFIFNIAINTFEEKVAVRELENILELAKDREALLKNMMEDKSYTGKISLAVQSTKFNVHLEYALLNKNGNRIITKNADTFITDDFIEVVKPKIHNFPYNKIVKVNVNNTNYVYTIVKTGNLRISPYVLLASKIDFANDIILIVNMILIVIAVITICIGLVLTLLISKGIIRPIRSLCDYTKEIGTGNFIDVPIGTSFKEIYELSSHMSMMSNQLQKLSENQRNFMQNVSHELRTPLMAIGSYAEGLKAGVFTDVHHASSIILDESNRLNTLVEQLLILSRIENQNYVYDMENINLSHVMLEYYQSLSGIAVKQNKVLTLDIKSEDVIINGNDMLLTQIFYNIITNCFRYAKEVVSVTLSTQDKKAIIIIADDGTGFEQQDIPHLFDRFYKGKKGKFGLGLTIAKTATEFIGGEIKAINGDVGAKFIITLPLLEK